MGLDCFIEAIENWPSSDIADFSAYLRGKYDFENLNDFCVPEHEIIRIALPELEILISTLESGLQLGAIIELKAVLTSIETKMTKSIESTI